MAVMSREKEQLTQRVTIVAIVRREKSRNGLSEVLDRGL